MGENKNAVNLSAVKPKGKIPLRRPKRRRENSTKPDLRDR
jgi:hypothetical protein